ncbi:hypothetical protein SAMN05421796_11072 [Chryseobacterium piscicola]|uniref:Uncharacterized protein n=1 Tax=Chryseobacterium piscicola TaxID=551459 RepID=A0A1N7P1F8_9FLAO|nr:hypothetical protein [Chryseobacterium piscicola]PQA92744.1 hypothetical protein B0A70_10185 [Chryseobacterium piscicola]SIT04394.1 hypothetical protein SAMN05421796_11072 [Chryseobacterium piscicola]
MKEELTTKMHSEFSVSVNTDIKHKCFCALKDMQMFSYSLEYVCNIYKISKYDIEKYSSEFNKTV